MNGRELDELLRGVVDADERDRLRRAHEALLAAGPAPELPPSLSATPDPERVRRLPVRARRRPPAVRLLALAAAFLAVAFAGGYLAGRGGGPSAFDTEFELVMQGTASAPRASASLRLGPKDDAGNWPMEMTVRGLKPGGPYELLLTTHGRPAASCGYFTVRPGSTVVYLNAPYRLRRFDGWIVTRKGSNTALLRTDRI